MERVTKKRMPLYSGRTHLALAEEIADHLGVELGDANLVEFANGEIRPPLQESDPRHRRLHHADALGCDGRSINDSIMEQLIMIDAAYRASAKRITAVCPFYGYARQDRKADGSRADHRPAGRRHVQGRRRQAHGQRRPALRPDPGLLRRPRRPPHGACPCSSDYMREHAERRRGHRVARRRPGESGRALRPAPRRPDADLAFINKRRPKGVDQRGRGQGGHRRRRGPALRHHRRHDRHRRHHRRRRPRSSRPGRHRGVGHGHPRRAVGPGDRPAEELAHLAGRRSPTPCRCRRRSSSTRSRCCRWPRSSPTPSPPSSTTRSVSEIFGGENQN